MHLRQAALEDAKLLFDFRNEEQTCKNSKNQAPVIWEHHLSWLKERITVNRSHIYIAEENGVPVGQIRLDIEDDAAIISYSVDKEHRGKGYGQTILAQIEKQLETQNDSSLAGNAIRILQAEVKETNPASQRCFVQLGYQLITCQNGILTYQKELPKKELSCREIT